MATIEQRLTELRSNHVTTIAGMLVLRIQDRYIIAADSLWIGHGTVSFNNALAILTDLTTAESPSTIPPAASVENSQHLARTTENT